MEQGRNVLAVTEALQQQLEQLQPSLPEGIEIVATYDRFVADLGHADEFLPGDRLRAARRHPRHRALR